MNKSCRSETKIVDKNKAQLLNRVLKTIENNLIALTTVLMVIVSVILATILKESDSDEWRKPRSLKYIGFFGEMYFRAMRGLIVPLIFSSLVYSMANIDTKLSSKIGMRTICYYMCTTIIAIILGIVFVKSIKPGSKASDKHPVDNNDHIVSTTIDMVLDLIRNLFTDNIIAACFESFHTTLSPPANESLANSSNIYDWNIEFVYTRGTNMTGIVMFAVVFGIAIGQIGHKASDQFNVLLRFMGALLNAVMTIMAILIQFTPLAVLFLVLPHLLSVDNISNLFASLGWYTLTAILANACHGFVILPLIYLATTRKNPYKHLMGFSSAALTAFGTASSTATLPITIQCLEERCALDKRIVRFVAPLGATINMDGTALCEAMAALFVAQYRQIDLSLAQILVVSIISTTLSVGNAGIPNGGPAVFVTVLSSVGLPIEDSALLYIVDWLVDRCRTTINVIGDGFGAAIVHHFSQNELTNDVESENK